MAKMFGGLAGRAEDALRKRQSATERKIAEATGDAEQTRVKVTVVSGDTKMKGKKNGNY